MNVIRVGDKYRLRMQFHNSPFHAWMEVSVTGSNKFGICIESAVARGTIARNELTQFIRGGDVTKVSEGTGEVL